MPRWLRKVIRPCWSDQFGLTPDLDEVNDHTRLVAIPGVPPDRRNGAGGRAGC